MKSVKKQNDLRLVNVLVSGLLPQNVTWSSSVLSEYSRRFFTDSYYSGVNGAAFTTWGFDSDCPHAALSTFNEHGAVKRLQINPKELGNIISAWSKNGGGDWNFFDIGTDPDGHGFQIVHFFFEFEEGSDNYGTPIIRMVTQIGETFDLRLGNTAISLWKSEDGVNFSRLWIK